MLCLGTFDPRLTIGREYIFIWSKINKKTRRTLAGLAQQQGRSQSNSMLRAVLPLAPETKAGWWSARGHEKDSGVISLAASACCSY
jgi:hypothetical protein